MWSGNRGQVRQFCGVVHLVVLLMILEELLRYGSAPRDCDCTHQSLQSQSRSDPRKCEQTMGTTNCPTQTTVSRLSLPTHLPHI